MTIAANKAKVKLCPLISGYVEMECRIDQCMAWVWTEAKFEAERRDTDFGFCSLMEQVTV